MLASDLLPKLRIDDPVEAFAVHGACAARDCVGNSGPLLQR